MKNIHKVEVRHIFSIQHQQFYMGVLLLRHWVQLSNHDVETQVAVYVGKGARVRPSTAGGSRPAIIFSI